MLWSGRLDEAVAFYRTLGIPLAEERHEDGPTHFATEIDGVHFAVYGGPPGSAPERRAGGHTQVGFRVEDLDATVAAAREHGATVLVADEEVPWGRRAVLLDPDGRCVELNQPPGPDRR